MNNPTFAKRSIYQLAPMVTLCTHGECPSMQCGHIQGDGAPYEIPIGGCATLYDISTISMHAIEMFHRHTPLIRCQVLVGVPTLYDITRLDYLVSVWPL